MRPPPAQTTSTNLASFWRNYVHIGVLTYSLGALVVVVYALTTPVSHREALVVLGCLSLAASLGPFRWLGLHLVATRWSKAFFTTWAACTFVFVATGSVLDGGVRSPFVYFLVLPMLFAGLAFSAGTVLLLGAFGVVATLVVGILTPQPSWSTTAFLALAVVIAGVITAAAALNRDRLMGRLMDAANLDALTGCLSRGAFQERLEHEARLARRQRSPFSLIVADLDNLKSLNDAGGHHSGDRALRTLAAVLTQVARRADEVGRLGGDEFALLLHGTDQDAALATASCLQDSIRAAAGSDLVTASLGVATWLGDDDRPDELLRRADEALYSAKRSGRDRCVFWEPEASEPQVGLQWLGRRPRRTVAASGV